MESRIYDSFSESKEGSAHGGGRSSTVPTEPSKGGLSQLLLDAATTLQGGHGPSKVSGIAAGQPDRQGKDDGRRHLPESLGKQAGHALAAWQRFFGHHHAQDLSTSPPKRPELPATSKDLASDSKGRKVARPHKAASQHTALEHAPDSSAQGDSPATAEQSVEHRPQQGLNGEERLAQSSETQPAAGSCRFQPATSAAIDMASGASQDLPAAMSPVARISSSHHSTMTHRRSSIDEDAAPKQVYYDNPHTSGYRPTSRFGQASAVCRDRLFIFGGCSSVWHSETYVFHAGRQAWTRVQGAGKNSPPATFGAAACSSKGKVFLFGGKQDQKPCRRLYTLNPDTLQWKAHKESASAPPPCSSHTLTAVGQHGIYTFGGEGKRLSNRVFALDPDTCQWSPVNTLGTPPPARQGHTATWDGADSLLIIGGNNGDKIFGDVRLLSLSTGYWSEVQCSGNIPAARHSHSAAMLDSNLLLLWGGCGDKGAVYNDAHILNITTFRWTRLESIGSPPTGRYCHSCGVIGRQVLLFGGTNAVHFFESLISVSVDMGSQLNSLAESLVKLTDHSANRQGTASQDLMRVQLGNHLRQRQAQDTSQVAMTRAEISQRLFEEERKRSEALSAEVDQLKMIVQDLEGQLRAQKVAHGQSLKEVQHARAAERGRSQDLLQQLQVAMERIKTLDSGAAIVDSYKAMFKQVLAERNLLAERNADLEFQISLRALPFETGASLDDPVNQRQGSDAWQSEHDDRSRTAEAGQSNSR